MNFARMIWPSRVSITFDSGKSKFGFGKAHMVDCYWMHAKIKKNCIIAEASYTMSVPWLGILVCNGKKS